jgi:hypothetical protein
MRMQPTRTLERIAGRAYENRSRARAPVSDGLDDRVGVQSIVGDCANAILGHQSSIYRSFRCESHGGHCAEAKVMVESKGSRSASCSCTSCSRDSRNASATLEAVSSPYPPLAIHHVSLCDLQGDCASPTLPCSSLAS